MVEKKRYWQGQIGKLVSARSYRDYAASGILLEVRDGLWGYGGDSVALRLDQVDDQGLPFFPADKAHVSPQAPN